MLITVNHNHKLLLTGVFVGIKPGWPAGHRSDCPEFETTAGGWSGQRVDGGYIGGTVSLSGADRGWQVRRFGL